MKSKIKLALSLFLFLFLFYQTGNTQIMYGQIKTCVRKTFTEGDKEYLPKGSKLDTLNSYTLRYKERKLYNLNITNRDWTISSNETWVPIFWYEDWGTNFKSIEEINANTLRTYNSRCDDKLLVSFKQQIHQTLSESYPAIRLLYESASEPIYSWQLGNQLSSAEYHAYYDLNQDGLSDLTVGINAQYIDTTLKGTTTSDNVIIDHSRNSFKPRNFDSPKKITAKGKIAEYQISIRFFVNDVVRLTLDKSNSGYFCYFGFSNEFTSSWSLGGRFVSSASWELRTNEWTNNIVPTFHPYNATYSYSFDADLLESDSLRLMCSYQSNVYRCNYSRRPYIESGVTGCPAFHLDTMFVQQISGIDYLFIEGYLTNVDPFAQKSVKCNEVSIPATVKIKKEIRRSNTVSIRRQLTVSGENLDFRFFDAGHEIAKYQVPGRQIDFLRNTSSPAAIPGNPSKVTFKWLNPSSSTTVSNTSSFTLVVRFYTTETIKDVNVIPLDNTKLTVEYEAKDSANWNLLSGRGYTDVYTFVKLKQETNKYKVAVTLPDGRIIETGAVRIDYNQSLVVRPPDKTRNLFVVSVGINSYKDNAFRDLLYCKKDALQMDSAFRNQNLLPTDQQIWDTIYTYLLIDSLATTANILNTIRNLPCEPSDVIVFFFSGHGKPVYSTESGISKFCMITHDCKQNNVEYTGLTYDLLMSELDDKGCHSIILLDACFSGTALNSKADESDIKTAIDENLASTGYTDKTVLTISSCSSRELSADDTLLQNGILARTILLALGNKSIKNSVKTDSLKPDMIRANKILDTDELAIFCRDGVPIISNKKQRSGSARRNSYNAINLFVLPE